MPTSKDVRRERAVARLLAKLPCTAAALTMPERGQLRQLEQAGVIVHTNGRWERFAPPAKKS